MATLESYATLGDTLRYVGPNFDHPRIAVEGMSNRTGVRVGIIYPLSTGYFFHSCSTHFRSRLQCVSVLLGEVEMRKGEGPRDEEESEAIAL